MCLWCVWVLFVHLIQDDLRCLFSPHQVNHGDVHLVPTCCLIPASYVVTLSNELEAELHHRSVVTSHSLLDGGVTCARCTRFPTCGVLTQTFATRGVDLDFSLTDFAPASSEVVLTFLPCTLSPVFPGARLLGIAVQHEFCSGLSL